MINQVLKAAAGGALVSVLLFGCGGQKAVKNGKGQGRVIPSYSEMVPGYKATANQVFVREITRPTLAALDYAAYNANPLHFNPDKPKFKAPATPALEQITLNGLLMDVKNSIAETPLSAAEQEHPMAWGGMKNRLWEALQDDALVKRLDEVEAYKWEDSTVYKSYQKITTLYLHQNRELWVKVDFAHWTDFMSNVTDSDGDGYKEVYAKVSLKGVPVDKQQQAKRWMLDSYLQRTLKGEEIQEWAQVLASYWYPTLNTDLAVVPPVWPAEGMELEEHIRTQLDTLKVNDPYIIIRGNPFGTAIYNVFKIKGMARTTDSDLGSTSGTSKQADRAMPKNFETVYAKLQQELGEHGGDYAAWAQELAAFQKSQRDYLASLPADQMGFLGKDSVLFFRRSLEMTLGGDLAEQKEEHNPIPHLLAFKDWLEMNEINFLLVPIPAKTEIYPDKLPASPISDEGGVPMVNPYYRKFVLNAMEEGIEVLDVLPALLQARASEAQDGLVYQKDDTHWTNRGLQIVSDLVAERVKQYSWYAETGADASKFFVKDTSFQRRGDIVERLPAEQQNAFPAVTLNGKRVYREGKPNKGSKADPILLVGDSFTGVYELVDCRNGGVSSHIARKTGLGVDLITSWGGGPNVRRKAYRARKKALAPKRVVIYMMAARDLYNYSQGWKEQEYAPAE